mmetsp:Transcript_130918/g.261179  ORF Transcript_130918/g.261179 Transcript_130918/m.261179 type:complete len:153 (-) Transcript_130918:3-461(-)
MRGRHYVPTSVTPAINQSMNPVSAASSVALPPPSASSPVSLPARQQPPADSQHVAQSSTADTVKIKLVDQQGNALKLRNSMQSTGFRMRRDTQMQNILDIFFAERSLPSMSVQREAGDPRATFATNGFIIDPDDTPASLHMPDMSVIEVTMH